jgi:hypothetical protein
MDPPSTDFGYLDPDSQKFTSIATSNRRYLFIIDTSCAQRADGLGIAHVIRIIAAENTWSAPKFIHNCFAALALFQGELSEPRRNVKLTIVYGNCVRDSAPTAASFLIVRVFMGKPKNGFACQNWRW